MELVRVLLEDGEMHANAQHAKDIQINVVDMELAIVMEVAHVQMDGKEMFAIVQLLAKMDALVMEHAFVDNANAM